MSTSKLQQETWERLHVLLGGFNVIENARPDWLRNPETGYTLELDFYLPEASIALEVQGEQHSRHIPFFHPTLADFEAQLQRDEIKRRACRERDIHLYEIFDTDGIESFIKDAGTYNGDIAHKLHKKYTALTSARWLCTRALKQFRAGDKDGAGALMQRVIKICQKYSISPESIKPVEEPPKIHQAFVRAKFATLYRGSKKKRQETEAAVAEINGNLVRCRWYANGDNGQLVSNTFDLQTGKQSEPAIGQWTLKPWTVPVRGMDDGQGSLCFPARSEGG